ncbi:MAG: SprT-like domain-containing protein [Nitrospinae bacterium]|nr:SprT-like domain-containing protein [Nitrospinota bacterium]
MLSLGASRNGTQEVAELTRMFTLKKNGMEYVGQLRIRPEDPIVKVEVFNETYFDEFEQPESTVLENLTQKVLGKVKKENELSDSVKALIKDYIEGQELADIESESIEQNLSEDAKDIDVMFDRLNREYFDDKIQATVKWGRDVKTQNKSGFRYGSYDENKKLIRLHPRLKQDFVPVYVLELTLYHEMCHQFAPSYKKNGSWQSHHPEFKKKEKEYRNFKDARNWEKNNWHKLLLPANEEPETVNN